jgi:predicted Zn-dependent peptidase
MNNDSIKGFKQQNEREVIHRAQDTFLNDLPLEEIDNASIRQVVGSYRNDNCSLDSCRTLFQKHSNYFYEWAHKNHMINVFYFER